MYLSTYEVFSYHVLPNRNTMQSETAAKKNTWILVLVAALGYFVDIYDLLIFSIVRVESLTEIGVAQENIRHMGEYVINMQMAGLLAGGILWGIIGDKFGRIKVLFGSILLYSIANLINGFVQDVHSYAIIRLIAGIGLAGELGAGITLVSETIRKVNMASRLDLVSWARRPASISPAEIPM